MARISGVNIPLNKRVEIGLTYIYGVGRPTSRKLLTELDISLVALTPIPMGSSVLAQDTLTGSNAALGGRGNCFRWSLPVGINAKYIVKATAGSGIAAAQLYVK